MALTINDKKFIKTLLDDVLEYKLDEKLDEKFKDKLGNLPTKDEFYEQTDKILKELKDIREKVSVLSQHSSDHSDAIEDLQKIHPRNSHPVFA
jgi:gamma-glutamyl phosphate reductase